MRVLRLIAAGLIAIGAVVAVMFAALVVFLTGLTAFVLQLFGLRKHAPPAGSSPATGNPPRVMRHDDVIEVETTKVTDETSER